MSCIKKKNKIRQQKTRHHLFNQRSTQHLFNPGSTQSVESASLVQQGWKTTQLVINETVPTLQKAIYQTGYYFIYSSLFAIGLSAHLQEQLFLSLPKQTINKVLQLIAATKLTPMIHAKQMTNLERFTTVATLAASLFPLMSSSTAYGQSQRSFFSLPIDWYQEGNLIRTEDCRRYPDPPDVHRNRNFYRCSPPLSLNITLMHKNLLPNQLSQIFSETCDFYQEWEQVRAQLGLINKDNRPISLVVRNFDRWIRGQASGCPSSCFPEVPGSNAFEDVSFKCWNKENGEYTQRLKHEFMHTVYYFLVGSDSFYGSPSPVAEGFAQLYSVKRLSPQDIQNMKDIHKYSLTQLINEYGDQHINYTLGHVMMQFFSDHKLLSALIKIMQSYNLAESKQALTAFARKHNDAYLSYIHSPPRPRPEPTIQPRPRPQPKPTTLRPTTTTTQPEPRSTTTTTQPTNIPTTVTALPSNSTAEPITHDGTWNWKTVAGTAAGVSLTAIGILALGRYGLHQYAKRNRKQVIREEFELKRDKEAKIKLNV